MRISLFHNERAGDRTSIGEVQTLVERYGHQLVTVVQERASAERILEGCPDLVVAAGGDGTVAAAVRVLAGRGIPLAILPLGTANNIAKSLSSHGSVEELIRGWDRATRRPLDVGVARGHWGTYRFLESVGAGLVPAGISQALSHVTPSDRPATRKPMEAAAMFREVLSRLEPRDWTITMDGEVMHGRFLLIEVLNMPSVGPNLTLSKHVDPSDGYFSVVIATERDRPILDDYLAHRAAGQDYALALEPRHACDIDIQGWSDLHIDDAVMKNVSGTPVHVSIERAALELLASPALVAE